jgi:nucleoside-diphosphate-sugar epimerase
MLRRQETVLITGADGFIGSHLTELLVHEGYKVKALSQYNSFNYWGWLEDVDCQNDIEVLNGDVSCRPFADTGHPDWIEALSLESRRKCLR